jgi:hypothetical protein
MSNHIYARKLMLAPAYKEPEVECMVEIEIDLDGVAEWLGRRGFRNKSKRSRAMDGLLKATVRETSRSVEARRR